MKGLNLISGLIFFIITLVQMSCQTSNPKGQNTETGLSQTSWELNSIHQKQVMTASMGDGIFITFEPYENRLSGFAGCNRFFGNYRTGESGSLILDGIGSTKMMCQNMATETEFLNAIRLVNKYKISGQTLELYQNETRLARFSKIPYRK